MAIMRGRGFPPSPRGLTRSDETIPYQSYSLTKVLIMDIM
jgi:hypothetical protein